MSLSLHDQAHVGLEAVRSSYLDDLTSSAAKKKNSELEKLRLPNLPDLKPDFLKLCDRLGVE